MTALPGTEFVLLLLYIIYSCRGYQAPEILDGQEFDLIVFFFFNFLLFYNK
jgi:hypothetical protein